MNKVEFFATPGYGEALAESLHYSQAVRIGDRIETSGQGGWDDEFNIPDSLAAEIQQAFANLERTLQAAGASMSDVVHVNSYHVLGGGGSAWEDHNAVMTPQFVTFFANRNPVWTQCGVTSLGLPRMRIEIRATAVVTSSD